MSQTPEAGGADAAREVDAGGAGTRLGSGVVYARGGGL